MKKHKHITRRQFLQAAAAAGLLVACGPKEVMPKEAAALPVDTPGPTATTTPEATAMPTRAPTRTPRPTSTIAPTPTTNVRIPDILSADDQKMRGKVVHTHHQGVWDGGSLAPEALHKMVDASITQLTGLNDTIEAWQSLFKPDEKIAIKVNAFRNSIIWTHVPLVTVVTDSLQKAGIPAENIVVFDFYTEELEEAGFTVNRDGPGVRCYGTDSDYTSGWRIVDTNLEISDVLLSCDALINMPVLKSHMLAGVSFALKNHYGTISRPRNFHSGKWIQWGLPELNALPPIKDRTRLVVGDALTACLRYKNAYPNWEPDWTGDSILMSFDPVAHDAVGFKVLTDALAADGGHPKSLVNMATPWFENAAELGLGISNLNDIDLQEVNL